jgi:hypothetical protein
MSKKSKYYHLPHWILLFAYLFLIGLSVLHHHHYDLNSHNILADEPGLPAASNDIIQDYTGNCIVHHFSSNLLNYFYSSSAISNPIPPVSKYVVLPVNYIPKSLFNSSLSLRAPPPSA